MYEPGRLMSEGRINGQLRIFLRSVWESTNIVTTTHGGFGLVMAEF